MKDIEGYQQSKRVGNLEINYYIRCNENSPLLIFIHGLGCAAKGFSSAWQSRCLDEYSLLAIDLVGHGASPDQNGFDYTMEHQAEVCVNLIESLGLEEKHLVGHSMGGAVALLVADKLKCQSLVSIEGSLVSSDCGPISRRPISMSLPQYEQAGFAQTKDYLAYCRPGTFYLNDTSARAFYLSSQSLVRWSESNHLLRRFNNLDLQCAYVFGAANAGIPAIAMLAPHIVRIQIDNATHFPMVENPEQLYSALSNFIFEGSRI